jgi:hypothetical protein
MKVSPFQTLAQRKPDRSGAGCRDIITNINANHYRLKAEWMQAFRTVTDGFSADGDGL